MNSPGWFRSLRYTPCCLARFPYRSIAVLMEVSETVSKFIRHSFDIGYVDINLDHHDSR